MKLVLDRALCSACDICLSSCRLSPGSRAFFNCRHCEPESAACRLACKKGAIKEIAPGVLGVDEEKCDGCGECARACPYNAILMQGGIAVKCDLCGGSPECVSSCPEGALFFSEGKADSLGWRVSNEGAAYFVHALPCMSAEEEQLVCGVVQEIKETSAEEGFTGLRGNGAGNFFDAYCEREGVSVDSGQREYLLEVVEKEVSGNSVLEPMLRDDSLEEIAVIGIGKPVYVYARERGWLKTNCVFTSEEKVVDLVNRMARGMGRRVTLKSPRLNAVLECGSRLHASIPPVSGVEVTIRKFRQKPLTFVDLLNYNTISVEALAFLWLAFQTDCSVLVAGNTASGKTSTLNALFSFVPLSERVLVVEETPEILLPHEHVCRLTANPELGVSLRDLITDSLRMRPDRVIVGEVRSDEEVEAFFQTVLSGQARGSYASFHGQSAGEAVKRLRASGVREEDVGSLDLLLVQRRMVRYAESARGKEVRRCTEVCELCESGKPRALFSYDAGKDALSKKTIGKRVAGKACEAFGFTRKELCAELAKRTRFLQGLKGSGPSLSRATALLQGYSWVVE